MSSQKKPPATSTGQLRARHRPIAFAAWFAGAGRDVLDQCPTETPFYNALGLAVLLTAVLSGVTIALALGFVLHAPPAHLWPVSLVWGLVIVNIDRLLVMMTSSKGWGLVIKLLPRVLVACAISVQIAEVLVLLLLSPEISAQLQTTNQQAYQMVVASVARYYSPQVVQGQREIVSLQAQENRLTAQVNHYRLIAACEAGEKSCSVTHEIGQGPVYHYYAQLAASTQTELDEIKPRDDAQIHNLEADGRRLSRAEAAQEAKAGSAVSNDTGLIAREGALSEVIRKHPGVGTEVWFIRGTLVLLDLLPLVLKVIHVLEGSAYEEIAAARKREETSAAYGIDLGTDVEKTFLSDKALADKAINRVKIQSYRDRLIAKEEAGYPDSAVVAGRNSAAATGGVSVSGLGLDSYVGAIHHHESMAVPVPRSLAVAGWIGSAIVTGLMLGLIVLTIRTGQVLRGEWLVGLATTAAVVVTIITGGYQRASLWAMRACFGLLLIGLCLPPLIFFTNL